MLRFVWAIVLCVFQAGALAADPLATVDGYRDFRATQISQMRGDMPNMPGELLPWAERQVALYEAEMAKEDAALEAARIELVARMDGLAQNIQAYIGPFNDPLTRQAMDLLREARDVDAAYDVLMESAAVSKIQLVRGQSAKFAAEAAKLDLRPMEAIDAYLLSHSILPHSGNSEGLSRYLVEEGLYEMLASLGYMGLEKAGRETDDPTNASLRVALDAGNSLGMVRGDPNAQDILTKVLAAYVGVPVDGGTFPDLRKLANALYRAGQFEDGDGVVARLLAEAPTLENLSLLDEVSVYLLASRGKTAQDEYEEALRLAEEALAMMPRVHKAKPAVLEAKGIAAWKMGDFATADEAFLAARGITLPPLLRFLKGRDLAELAAVHADLLEEMGEIPRALEARRAQLDHLNPPEGTEVRAEIEAHIARLSGQ